MSTRRFGQIQSLHSNDCIQKPSNGRNPTGKVITTKCAIEVYGPQNFVAPPPEREGFIMTDESVCLDVSSSNEHSSVLLIACSEFDRQKWIFREAAQQIVHHKSNLCLTLSKRGTFLSITRCRRGYNRQRWTFVDKRWRQ